MASFRSSTSAIASVSILRASAKYCSPGVPRTGTSSRTMLGDQPLDEGVSFSPARRPAGLGALEAQASHRRR